MEIKKYLDRDGLFYMANKIKGLLAGKANVDLSNVDNSIFKAKAESAGASGGVTNVTTEGAGGAEYTVTIDGITTLAPGLALLLTPHETSTSTTPTLNVNGLGAVEIRRRLSNISTSPQPGYAPGWLAAGYPVLLVYDGKYWTVTGQDRPASADLSGTVSVAKGGTGADTAEAALENLGAMPIAGGTFTGTAAAGEGSQSADEYVLRNSKIAAAEEDPTVNGQICWKYE